MIKERFNGIKTIGHEGSEDHLHLPLTQQSIRKIQSPGGRSETTGSGGRICETDRFKPKVREGVMDEQSGESEEEEVTCEGICESEMEELVPE